MNEIISIILLSLFVSVISTLAATVFGVLISLVILFKDFRLKKLVIKLTNTFMSMPPVLMGLLMYLTLSRKGPLGSFKLLFTPTAIIITQTFLILPIIISLTYSYLNSIEEDIRRNCAALGISKKHTVYIMIKESLPQMISIVSTGFGRGISEVGAAMMIGGNIKGYTRIMTTYIAMETGKGNFNESIILGLVLLFISFSINFFLGYLEQ